MMEDAMTMIEQQKQLSRQLTRLTDVLQQDDPSYQDVDFEQDGIPPETVKETLESAQVGDFAGDSAHSPRSPTILYPGLLELCERVYPPAGYHQIWRHYSI
jgi:hypothetical protein